MEEIEAPMEAIIEDIHHHAHEATHSSEHSNEKSKDKWISQVALSSAIYAVLAAITALLANHHANEAMIETIQASDQWGYYQAKGVKAAVLGSKIDLLTALGKIPSRYEKNKLFQYKNEQEEIAKEALEKGNHSEKHLRHHVTFARGVTLFQIAIAISAISVLTKKRRFWLVSIGFSVIGLAFLIQGLFLIR